MKIKYFINPSITKWGIPQPQPYSFQKFTDKICAFRGDGKVEGIIGWGKTEKEAIRNLWDNEYNQPNRLTPPNKP